MGKPCLVFGVLSLALLGYAGYRYAADGGDPDPSPGEALVVAEPEQDLGRQEPATAMTVRFRLENRSSRSIRVLGLAPG